MIFNKSTLKLRSINKKPIHLSILISCFILFFENTKINAMDFRQGGIHIICITPNEANRALLKSEELGYTNSCSYSTKNFLYRFFRNTIFNNK